MTEQELLLSSSVSDSTIGMAGAIFVLSAEQFNVSRSRFVQNTGCRGGGALRVMIADLPSRDRRTFSVNISQCHFLDNAAFCGEQPDALRHSFDPRFALLGGAIMYEALNEIDVLWTVERSHFFRNRARAGGAISLQTVPLSLARHRVISSTFEENRGLIAGGSILGLSAHVILISSNITRSRALNGGGILAWQSAQLEILPNLSDPFDLSYIEGCESIYGSGISADAAGLISVDLSHCVMSQG